MQRRNAELTATANVNNFMVGAGWLVGFEDESGPGFAARANNDGDQGPRDPVFRSHLRTAVRRGRLSDLISLCCLLVFWPWSQARPTSLRLTQNPHGAVLLARIVAEERPPVFALTRRRRVFWARGVSNSLGPLGALPEGQ